jgi:hypothetical protein
VTLSGVRVDRSGYLVPDLYFIAVGVVEEDIGLAGDELALLADCSPGGDHRGGGGVWLVSIERS